MKIVFCFLFLFLVHTICAQTISFKLVDYVVIDSNSTNEFWGKFGGISSIEPIPIDFFKKGNTTYSSAKGYFLTADHYPNEKGNIPQKSYTFLMDGNYDIKNEIEFFGLNSIESVRYNDKLQQLFFCYEEGLTSGVGLIKKENDQQVIVPIFPDTNFCNNRGVEGITFTSDNSLWIANESGSKGISGDTVLFYCIPFDIKTMSYDVDKKMSYSYSFNKCACLNDCSLFNGQYGSGISEILAIKNDPHKLLVLERCFDGKKAHARLFLATIEAGTQTLSKEIVFDFNSYFVPDNLEGMCWGKDVGEENILYLVSDDNYCPDHQKNQIIKLKMITAEK